MYFNLREKPGKHYSYQDLEFFAHAGMIHIFDKRDGSSKIVSPDAFEERIPTKEEALRCSVLEWRQLAQLYKDMDVCIAEARTQGDPTKDHVNATKSRHRSPQHVIVPDLPYQRRSPNGIILGRGN